MSFSLEDVIDKQHNTTKSGNKWVALLCKCKNANCSNLIKLTFSTLSKAHGFCKSCRNKKRPHEAQYNALVATAKRSNKFCDLTYKQYINNIANIDCYWCGDVIPWLNYSNKTGGYNHAYYTDRLDPTQGYTVSNCVACCSRCNFAKRTQTKEEFIEMCRKVVERWS